LQPAVGHYGVFNGSPLPPAIGPPHSPFWVFLKTARARPASPPPTPPPPTQRGPPPPPPGEALNPFAVDTYDPARGGVLCVLSFRAQQMMVNLLISLEELNECGGSAGVKGRPVPNTFQKDNMNDDSRLTDHKLLWSAGG